MALSVQECKNLLLQSFTLTSHLHTDATLPLSRIVSLTVSISNNHTRTFESTLIVGLSLTPQILYTL
jgi:hypothetical protein